MLKYDKICKNVGKTKWEKPELYGTALKSKEEKILKLKMQEKEN